MLVYLWSASVLLSLLSLAVMSALILRRLLLQRRERTNALARQQLVKALIGFSHDRDRARMKQAALAAPVPVALDAGGEFLSLLRGDEHDDLIGIFSECGLPGHVRRQLLRGNRAARILATEMLAAYGVQDAVPALRTRLERDRAREVRIAAAIALCDLDALPPLDIALAQIGPAGQRSRRLIELFGRLPADRLDELTLLAANPGLRPPVRAAAMDAMARTGDFRLAGAFLAAARDPAPEVAAAAIRALGRFGHREVPAVLAEAMADPDWRVRSEAAEAAGRLGLGQFLGPLAALLGDEAWTVRYAAAKSMRAIPPKGEEMLRQIAASQTSRRQRTASLILSEGPAA